MCDRIIGSTEPSVRFSRKLSAEPNNRFLTEPSVWAYQKLLIFSGNIVLLFRLGFAATSKIIHVFSHYWLLNRSGIPKNDPYNQEQPIRPTIVKGRAYFQDTESSLWVVFRFTKKGPFDIVSLSKSFFIFSVYHWSKSTFFVSYPMYFWFLLLNEGWKAAC